VIARSTIPSPNTIAAPMVAPLRTRRHMGATWLAPPLVIDVPYTLNVILTPTAI
jgi:hypothetical protein